MSLASVSNMNGHDLTKDVTGRAYQAWLRSSRRPAAAYNPAMPQDAESRPAPQPRETTPARPQPACDPPTVCDRCGAEMFRMHAVWRCPACGYKTDCCGW
jgi:hypothetical protein